MRCPNCGCSSYLTVDGVEMSEYELLHLRRAPREIKRRLPHMVWCPSDQNRMSLLRHIPSPDPAGSTNVESS